MRDRADSAEYAIDLPVWLWNTPGSPDAFTSGPGVRGVLEHYIEPYIRGRVRRGELTARTGRNQRGVLAGFAASYGQRAVSRLGRADVERWLERYEHHAPGTRRLVFNVVRAFCRWLVQEGKLRRDPTFDMRAPKEPRVVPRALPLGEVQAMLAAARDRRDRLLAILGVQEGLRIGEMARLELGDIDFPNRQMRVTGKGGHERVVHVTEEAMEEIHAYLAAHPATRGPLIRSHAHPTRGLSANYVGALFRRMLYEAGVKRAPLDGKSAHATRHTCFTDMLRHGAHVRDVQAAAGHRMLATTERYLPLVVDSLENAMGGRRYLTAG